MLLKRRSIISGIERELDLPITEHQLALFDAGALIQDAFPNLGNDEREFIKTGITAEEWAGLFPEEEEATESENDADAPNDTSRRLA